MEKYPALVTKLTSNCQAWIIGSSIDSENPRDYDIFVPMAYWKLACSIIPVDAKINRMGGFKCMSEGKEVDVWTGCMSEFLASNYFKSAFHPQTGIKIKRE